MKVYLATDHTGIKIKDSVKTFLQKEGYNVQDCGAYEYDKDDDYPDLISKAAKAVSKDQSSRGIIFGGSGQGEAIVANKFNGVRCALFYTPAVPTQPVNIEGKQSTDPFEMIALTREHNNANMLSIGIRFVKEDDVLHAVKAWLQAPDTKTERHLRRIAKIAKIEENR